MATILDRITAAQATAKAKKEADDAAAAADAADATTESALLGDLVTTGPVGVLSDDGHSFLRYAVSPTRTLDLETIPLAGFVTLPDPTPAPTS